MINAAVACRVERVNYTPSQVQGPTRSSASIDTATMTVEGVLFSLAVLHAAGIEHPLRDLVSFFSGRQSGKDNSGFRADRRAAQKLEYVESPDAATLRLTPAGHEHLRIRAVHRPPATNRDIHAHILRTLAGDRSRQLFGMLTGTGGRGPWRTWQGNWATRTPGYVEIEEKLLLFEPC
jgi:hypothetical protein